MPTLKINTRLLDLQLGTGTSYSISLEEGIVKEVGNNRSPNPAADDLKEFTTPVEVVQVSTATTLSIGDPRFPTSVSVTFNRPSILNTGNFYLYDSDGLFRTISVTSTNVTFVGEDTSEILISSAAIPEGNYFLGWDSSVIKDLFGIGTFQQTTNQSLSWNSKSLSDQPDQEYDSQTLTQLFPDWWDIYDRDPDPDKEYALRMFANSGTFVVNGTPSDDLFVRFGTRTELEALDSELIQFSADVKDMNWDLPLTTTLMKDATVIATRQNTLIGKPFDLASLVLVSNTFTNSVGSSTVLTVTANTNSSITSEVIFRTSSIVFGTSTFVNNVATLTLQPDTLSAGTYNIFADWNGQTIVPKFNGRNSDPISQTLLPKADTLINLTISTGSYIVRPEVGTTPNPNPIVSVQLPAVYPTHSSIGNITLKDGNLTIAVGSLLVSNTQSTVNLTWDPDEFNQVDTGTRTLTAFYDGDFWNKESQASINFNASTRNRTTMSIAASTSALIRPDSITFTATTPNNNFSGKSITWYEGSTEIGTSSFTGNTATLTLNSMDLSIGLKSVKAEFNGDFNFEPITSNLVTFTVEKRTPTVTLTASSSPLRRPAIGTITATYRYNGVLIDRTGRTITFKRNGSTIDTQTASGNSDQISQDSMTLALQNYSYTATLQGDDIYNEVTSDTLILTIAKGILSPDITFNPFYPSQTANPTTVRALLNSTFTGTMTLKHTFQNNTTTVIRSIATLTNTSTISTLPITLEAGSAIDSIYSYPGIHTFNLTATGAHFEDINYTETLKKFDYSKSQFLDITTREMNGGTQDSGYPSFYSNVVGPSVPGYELGFNLAPFRALLSSKAYENVDNVNENIRVIVRELNSLDISDVKSGGKAVDHTLNVYQTAWSNFKLWNTEPGMTPVSAILIRGDKVAITGYSSNFTEFPGSWIFPSPYYSIEVIYQGDENNDIPASTLKGVLDSSGNWYEPTDTRITVDNDDYFLWHTAEFTTNTTTNLTVTVRTFDSSKPIDGLITITGPNNYPISSGYPNTSTGIFEANWDPISVPNFSNYLNESGLSITTTYPLTIVISTGTNNKSTSTTYGYVLIDKEAVSAFDSFLYVNGYTVTGDPESYNIIVSGSNILGRTGTTEYVTATNAWSAFGTTSIYMRYGNTSTLLGSSIGQPTLTVSPPGGYFTATTTSTGLQTYVITAEFTSTFVVVPPLSVTIQKTR